MATNKKVWTLNDLEQQVLDGNGAVYDTSLAHGGLWTWGNNENGELGDGTVVNKSSPIQVGSLTNWSNIAAGHYHTTAIKSDGTLWTWGYNAYGQLGDGTIVNKQSPIQVGNLTNWSNIEVGYYHNVAIKSD